MQAITTRFLPATNTKGARIVAETEKKRKVSVWNHEADSFTNHREAAEALARGLGWLNTHRLHSGTAKGGLGVHVLALRALECAYLICRPIDGKDGLRVVWVHTSRSGAGHFLPQVEGAVLVADYTRSFCQNDTIEQTDFAAGNCAVL